MTRDEFLSKTKEIIVNSNGEAFFDLFSKISTQETIDNLLTENMEFHEIANELVSRTIIADLTGEIPNESKTNNDEKS